MPCAPAAHASGVEADLYQKGNLGGKAREGLNPGKEPVRPAARGRQKQQSVLKALSIPRGFQGKANGWEGNGTEGTHQAQGRDNTRPPFRPFNWALAAAAELSSSGRAAGNLSAQHKSSGCSSSCRLRKGRARGWVGRGCIVRRGGSEAEAGKATKSKRQALGAIAKEPLRLMTVSRYPAADREG